MASPLLASTHSTRPSHSAFASSVLLGRAVGRNSVALGLVSRSPKVGAACRGRRRATVVSALPSLPPDLTSSIAASVTSLSSTATGLSILAGVIVFHELGHYLAARAQGIRVKNFSVGFGPKLLSYTPPSSETEFTLRLIPFGGFVAFPDASEFDEETGEERQLDDPNLLQNRPVLDRIIVISAGVIANVILAWSAIFASVAVVGTPQTSLLPGTVVSQVSDAAGPAARAGIRVGDIVLSVDGEKVPANPSSAFNVASTIRSSGGKTLNLEVQRDNEIFPVKVAPKCCTPSGDALLGVQLSTRAEVVRVKTDNPLKTITQTNKEFGRIFNQTITGFSQFVTNFQRQASNVTGPIGVVSMGADIARNDTNGLFIFMAIISMNLAVINSVPLPALDGGQFAFLLIEAAMRSPVPQKYQNAINQTFLALLLFLSVELLVKDVSKLTSFGQQTLK
eukprot:CAMPEP_0198337814 /NCGR_PEP_ID=MMETSP1450-20131203/31439_1 /TAXON_ID=753684 ORGANISM="Madagascaria erythrocladiodes, Strain CCMP3234" /NCGR_SAMPLE_ID=MMETSP1450 /ASSEMBLY_ACC=CAM_ASM_001115 /LENGTH=450 /DNA_ID=CAMNT_0044042651 /DNA_START=38 /DNA_END=1390 /DNA_ORIENTATION=+